MPVKFPYAELRTIARDLELRLPEQAENLEVDGDSIGRRCAEAYAPLIKTGADLSSVPKSMHETYKQAIGFAVHQIIRHTRKTEATLAGVDLPSALARQKIAMVMRAYPKLVAPQIVGFFPMKGPAGFIGYSVAKYENAYTASSPVVAAGDEVNDPTKPNKGYTTVAEGDQSRKVKRVIARQTVTATTHRVINEYSQDLVEDAAAEWDIDMPSMLIQDCGDVMAQSIDVEVIDAIAADSPSAADTAFDMTPASAPDYSSLTPSEQREYRELLIKDGFVSCINKINRADHFGDGSPNFAILSPNAAQSLEGVRGFSAVQNSPDSYDLKTGAIRYVGDLNNVGGGLRIFTSEFVNRGETTTGIALLGRRPTGMLSPGIRVGMYIPLQYTDALYDPNTDMTVKGLRSRYVVCRKDGGVTESSQLVRCYGKLTITL